MVPPKLLGTKKGEFIVFDEDLLMDVPPVPRFNVSGSKTMYRSSGFETAEEALAEVTELVQQGFASITLRDNEQDDVW